MDVDGQASTAMEAASVGSSSTKRKRSASTEPPTVTVSAATTTTTPTPAPLPPPPPPPKAARTHSNSHLQINYLARQYADILPLISSDDTLPVVLSLLSEYGSVLDRHESLASNLGARPLGPILMQRFERIFDGQPRVLKNLGKDLGNVTWLDVVEFARQKPEQFNLEKTREGARVCQFVTKQCRVEISEDDYTLIASGIPQKLIPPQPISEDEEKELGTLEIMEKRITALIQLADQGKLDISNFAHIVPDCCSIRTRTANQTSYHQPPQCHCLAPRG